MKYIRILLTVVFGAIYWPVNNLNAKVQKWYLGMREKDKIIFYCFTPFYALLFLITFIVSIPYEFIIAVDLH